MATTNLSRPAAAPSDTREALLAYMDALTLAEPMQARLWQQAEITLTQLTVLRELRTGRHTAGRLGEKVGLSPTSLTRLVDRLERRGLVNRQRVAGDRRLVEIALTASGERLLGEIKVFRGSPLFHAVEAMTAYERRRLTDSLRRLVSATRALGPAEGDGE